MRYDDDDDDDCLCSNVADVLARLVDKLGDATGEKERERRHENDMHVIYGTFVMSHRGVDAVGFPST